jgi:hypothetical protein
MYTDNKPTYMLAHKEWHNLSLLSSDAAHFISPQTLNSKWYLEYKLCKRQYLESIVCYKMASIKFLQQNEIWGSHGRAYETRSVTV